MDSKGHPPASLMTHSKGHGNKHILVDTSHEIQTVPFSTSFKLGQRVAFLLGVLAHSKEGGHQKPTTFIGKGFHLCFTDEDTGPRGREITIPSLHVWKVAASPHQFCLEWVLVCSRGVLPLLPREVRPRSWGIACALPSPWPCCSSPRKITFPIF